jgi:transposase
MRQHCVIEQVVDGKITNRQAAEVLGLTERQVIRLKERMKAEGVTGRPPGETGFPRALQQ